MEAINIKNLRVSFDLEDDTDKAVEKKDVLSSISLSVNEGEFICILGKNGSGKSTLVKTINGIIKPTSGDVIVYGLNTKDEDSIIEIRKNVGIAFQNPDNQIVASIVEEDIAFGLENIGIETNEIRRRIDNSLKVLGIVDLKEKQTSKLSGGQKQKVSLAGILAMKSKIMILDEPTSMIDYAGRIDLLETVKKLNREEKITVILISHFVEEISYADRVIVMNNGKIAFDDLPKNVLLHGSELSEIGIELPYICRLATDLKKLGKKVKGNELIMEELCQYLR